MSFPWEFNQGNLCDFFGGAYLFGALFRVYKSAYYGQGFQFYGAHPRVDRFFKEKFETLPLDIKQIILSQVWNNGIGFNEIIVKSDILYLKYQLQFLFAQRGRIKYQTQPIGSKGIGSWNGFRFSRQIFIFKYNQRNFESKIYKPTFFLKDPKEVDDINLNTLCI